MWMPHDRLCGVARSIAVGSGLFASLAGTAQIPAAIPEYGGSHRVSEANLRVSVEFAR
jgi:hypothetical protein